MSDTPPVVVEGVDDLTDLLDGQAGRLDDVSPLADGIYASFLEIETKRFDAEGPGWAELADSTLQQKAAHGYPATILEETAALRDSLTDHAATGAVFVPVFGDEMSSITMGTNLKPARPGRGWEGVALAFFHQGGTRKMPSRPVIDDDADMLIDWSEQLAEWLSTGNVTALL